MFSKANAIRFEIYAIQPRRPHALHAPIRLDRSHLPDLHHALVPQILGVTHHRFVRRAHLRRRPLFFFRQLRAVLPRDGKLSGTDLVGGVLGPGACVWAEHEGECQDGGGGWEGPGGGEG